MKKKEDFLPPNKTKKTFFVKIDARQSRRRRPMKNKQDFLPPNKTKMSFLFFIYFVGARMTWRKRIG